MRRIIFLLCILVFQNFDLVEAITCTVETTGQSGECIFIGNCPVVLMEYQKLKKMPTICDRQYRTVCCPSAIKQPIENPITSTTARVLRRISAQKCREYAEYVYENVTAPAAAFGEKPIVKRIDQCAIKSVGLIVGGEPAKEREFPHMALIGYQNGLPDDYKCGGSLISDLWVLSAAHCSNTYDGPAKYAKLGNVVRHELNANTWTYSIIQRVPHPAYNSRFAEDDIALFKLSMTVQFNKFVLPICLPDTEAITTKRAIATGYGQTGFAEDSSDQLMKVVIEYFEPEKCNKTFEDDEKLKNGINWSKMLCLGSNNKTGDTCGGDSGGPLQIYHSEVYCMYSLIGLTSFGSAYCGAIGIPAIYTKVYYFLDWIEQTVWN